MSVSILKIHERLAREFGASVDSERFGSTCRDAINDAIDDLNQYTSLDLDPIDTMSGTIDIDQGPYLQAILASARASIADSGEWGRTPKGDLLALKIRALGQAQTRYQEDEPPTVRFATEDETTEE